jgi:hypothetical protein
MKKTAMNKGFIAPSPLQRTADTKKPRKTGLFAKPLYGENL